MIRGSTPTHTFTVPFDLIPGTKVRIVYAQNNKIILERETETCTVTKNVISIDLTSDETLLFDCSPHYVNGKWEKYPIEIQVGIDNGKKIWSYIFTETAERCLKEDGVI